MKTIYFQAIPFDKAQVTLALESGVDGVITSAKDADAVRALAKIEVLTPADLTRVALGSKADEQDAAKALAAGARVVLAHGWEIIPVENLLAQGSGLGCEVKTLDEARLAAGILERRGLSGCCVH